MRFVNPLFLIALVAVAIPILVHLFHFRRYKKVYFSNVALLREMQEETKRQSNLRRLLILLSRILAVVFLVLAFAQPYIPNNQAQKASSSAYVSIYLDNSFSMGGDDTYGMLLEHGKNKVREIASAYKPSDNFQLVTNDFTGSQFRWLNKEELLEVVDDVQLSPLAKDLSEVLRRQYDFMHANCVGTRYAYLISDFQKSVTHFSDFVVDSSVSVTFVPLQAAAIDNLYIDSVALNAPAFFVGGDVALEVYVRNTGETAVEGAPVRLFVGDKQRAMSSVDVPAKSYATVTMHLPIEQHGVLQCRVETVDYPITFDDQFFFSINVSDRIPVLDIYGQATPNQFLERLFSGDSAVVYQTVSMQRIDFSTLGDHRFVVLDALSTLPSGLVQTLVDFVHEGGSLLVAPPEKCDVNAYNNLLRKLQMPLLGKWSDQTVNASEINVNSHHYQNVFSGSLQDVEYPTAKGRYLTERGASVLEPIISFADGNCLVSETQWGLGKCFLMTSPLNVQYNDFMQQALFVPTFYNMALFSTPATGFYAMFDNQQPILLSRNDYQLKEGNVVLRGAKTDVIPDIRTVGGRCLLYLHGEISESGNYDLLVSDSKTEGISLNYSRQESELLFFEGSELVENLKQFNIDNFDVVKTGTTPLDQYIKKKTEGTPLYRYCIVLALLFLLAEIVLLVIKPKNDSSSSDKRSVKQ